MNRTVTALDVFQNTHTVTTDQLKWRVSVYGVLLKGNSIMFQKNPHFDKLSLPGGMVEFGENLEEALCREFSEETGYKIKPTKFLQANQRYFASNGSFFQNICLYYLVEQQSDIVEAINSPDNDSVQAIFIDLRSISLDNIQPMFQDIIKTHLCH